MFKIKNIKNENDIINSRGIDYFLFYKQIQAQGSNLIESISLEKSKNDRSGDFETRNLVINKVDELLDCKFSNFVTRLNETLTLTQRCLENGTFKRIMNSIISLSSLLSLFIQVNVSKSESYSNLAEISQEYDAESTEICRLCNSIVQADRIIEHTESCIQFFQKEAKIRQIDEDIEKLKMEIAERFLDCKWMSLNQSHSFLTIQMFHLYVFLDQAIQINPILIDSAKELEQMAQFFVQFFFKYNFDFEIKLRAKSLLVLKKNLCDSLLSAMSVLLETVHTKSLKHMYKLTINDFIIESKISKGAFATVSLAHHNQTGDVYAIKTIPQADLKSETSMKRIFTERDILNRLNHPRVVRFYYSLKDNSNVYLVMEYLKGGDLGTLIDKMGSFPEEVCKFFVFQILEGLNYLHSKGIIHRDMKPKNILLTENGYIKITDFGLSYKNEKFSTKEDCSDVSKSAIGTPYYIAPEILMFKRHSVSVDYWSLGIMLYEFIEGTPPFVGDTIEKITHSILSAKYDPMFEDHSPELEDFVSRLIQFDPEKRLGSKGVEEVFNHPWLRDYVLDDNIAILIEQEIKNNPIPKLKLDSPKKQIRPPFKHENDYELDSFPIMNIDNCTEQNANAFSKRSRAQSLLIKDKPHIDLEAKSNESDSVDIRNQLGPSHSFGPSSKSYHKASKIVMSSDDSVLSSQQNTPRDF